MKFFHLCLRNFCRRFLNSSEVVDFSVLVLRAIQLFTAIKLLFFFLGCSEQMLSKIARQKSLKKHTTRKPPCHCTFNIDLTKVDNLHFA